MTHVLVFTSALVAIRLNYVIVIWMPIKSLTHSGEPMWLLKEKWNIHFDI